MSEHGTADWSEEDQGSVTSQGSPMVPGPPPPTPLDLQSLSAASRSPRLNDIFFILQGVEEIDSAAPSDVRNSHPASGDVDRDRHPANGDVDRGRHPASGDVDRDRHPASGGVDKDRPPADDDVDRDMNANSSVLGHQDTSARPAGSRHSSVVSQSEDTSVSLSNSDLRSSGDEGQGATVTGDHLEPERSSKRNCSCIPLRYFIAWMVFIGMIIINAMRTNVGVTVLTILDRETHGNNTLTDTGAETPKAVWDTKMIGFLHSIFYVGYILNHLPAGYLTTRLPSHKLFGGCILVSCTLNLTLPVALEKGGYTVTMVVRFIQGFSEGILYPSLYGILRHWTTPLERGRVGSLVLTGAYLGPVVGFPLAGIITYYLGWPYIYYVNGGIGILYVLLWVWLSEEKPSHHKRITSDELAFIEFLQGSERIDYEGARIPWLDILTSLPVLSLCLCNFARNWVFILMLTNEPLYLNMFKFSIAENGVYSALPHVFKMSASLISGLLADCFLSKRLMSTTHTRKLLTGGFAVQAVFFGLLTLTENGTVAMTLLTVAIGFGGFVVSGWQLNHYDLSAPHASVLVAVTSTFGDIGSISAPIVAGYLTSSLTFRSWNKLFYITSSITGLACISFFICGSGERQPWAVPADANNLVIKADKLRRASRTATGTSPNSTPIFTYSKLRETNEGHVTTSYVPNYGSQEKTTPSPVRNSLGK